MQVGEPRSNHSDETSISSAAVFGNMFISIIAGHETSANTLTYAMTLLACCSSIQRALQTDLDKLTEGSPLDDYATVFPLLLESYIGATMNETLRLYGVLPFVPKTTEGPQTMSISDRSLVVPASTFCMINTNAVHRNPKFWPETRLSRRNRPPYPVSAFDPSIWLQKNDAERFGNRFLRLVPGSYIPFAEGPRACHGKRFAQSHFCAAMATIFKNYTVELAVGDDVEQETPEGSNFRWDLARRNAEQKLSNGVEFFLSLKMKESVPLKLMKRNKVS